MKNVYEKTQWFAGTMGVEIAEEKSDLDFEAFLETEKKGMAENDVELLEEYRIQDGKVRLKYKRKDLDREIMGELRWVGKEENTFLVSQSGDGMVDVEEVETFKGSLDEFVDHYTRKMKNRGMEIVNQEAFSQGHVRVIMAKRDVDGIYVVLDYKDLKV